MLVKGSGTGAVTDINGTFSVDAAAGSTLEISFVGYKTETVKVTSNSTYAVTLQDDSQALSEVVVTAMGIKKEKKALGYAVSDLGSKEILKNKNTNVINSLAGKVPGVNITQSSGAAGAGASITIRGGNSTSEGRENQPLFVVDGIIYDNSTQVVGNSGTDGMTRSNTTYSNRVMDINPEDIENMSVLKGTAAAALYGSRAADGVIIITTKKGAEGSVKVDVSSKLSTSWTTKLPEAQTIFGRGYYENNGVFNDLTYKSWSEEIAAGTPIYDNIGNFFQNGAVWDNNVSVSGGTKNSSFFLSLSNYDQQGIVRKTGYNKTTVRFNGEQKYARLTVGANVSYSIADTDKTLTSGGLYDGGCNGAMSALYSWPQTEDMSKYLNEDGSKYRLFDRRWDLADDKENSYWIINKDKMTDKTKRFTGALNASFKIADWWDISARVGYDQYKTEVYTYIAPGSVVKEIYQNGRLNKSDYDYTYISTNVMTNFHKTFGDFDFNLLLGTASESTERLNQTHWGYNFITAGTISFANISNNNKFFNDNTIKKTFGRCIW
ncbi:MAG: TonB-dependent receptor plug domain-containing protein [Bacteroides sp.]|nr:TonB-dependent receptor plug domain-containing protein [Bacteroides sp.]